MKKYINFRNSLMFGIISNIFFIFFILFCLVYYDLHWETGTSMFFEVTACIIETLGFLFMTAAIICMVILLQHRILMKVSLAVYLLVEIIIMLADFELITLGGWYNGYSKTLIIGHSIFSAFVCITHLSLDRKKGPLQIVVAIASAVMLAGMLAIAYQKRIYISVLTNTFAYLFLYIAIMTQLKYEILDIDCYGYKARVAEYKSSFFE